MTEAILKKELNASIRKSGKATKGDQIVAKRNLAKSKKELKKIYKKLKTDKLADQGKELYKSGKTITDNALKTRYRQIAVVVGSAVIPNIIASTTGNIRLANMSAATLSVGGTAVNATLAMQASSQNKKLRAYYAH